MSLSDTEKNIMAERVTNCFFKSEDLCEKLGKVLDEENEDLLTILFALKSLDHIASKRNPEWDVMKELVDKSFKLMQEGGIINDDWMDDGVSQED